MLLIWIIRVQEENEQSIAKANLNQSLQRQAGEESFTKITRELFNDYGIILLKKWNLRRSILMLFLILKCSI